MRTWILCDSHIPPAIPAIHVFPLQDLRHSKISRRHPVRRHKGKATPLIRKLNAFPWICQLPKFPGPCNCCLCKVWSVPHLLCYCKSYTSKCTTPQYNTEICQKTAILYSARYYYCWQQWSNSFRRGEPHGISIDKQENWGIWRKTTCTPSQREPGLIWEENPRVSVTKSLLDVTHWNIMVNTKWQTIFFRYALGNILMNIFVLSGNKMQWRIKNCATSCRINSRWKLEEVETQAQTDQESERYVCLPPAPGETSNGSIMNYPNRIARKWNLFWGFVCLKVTLQQLDTNHVATTGKDLQSNICTQVSLILLFFWEKPRLFPHLLCPRWSAIQLNRKGTCCKGLRWLHCHRLNYMENNTYGTLPRGKNSGNNNVQLSSCLTWTICFVSLNKRLIM